MKTTKYPAINTLPAGAMRVSEYAALNNITVAYVYIKYGRGKAEYEIRQFQGINFILP